MSEAEQQEQKKQAQLQANQPAPAASSSTTADEQKKSDEATSAAAASSTQQKEPEKKLEITPEEEKKVVESVLKQLTPFVEQLVAAEIRRVLSGQTDSDDENGFNPFQFLLGGPMFATARGGPTGQTSQEQSSGARVRKKLFHLF